MTASPEQVDQPELEQRAINVIRGLSMDGPHAANSGHQGTGMALAPLAHVLWTRVMNYDSADPDWPDRDRFILSAGHASILLYSMLHLSGQGLELDDLRNFRQWDSRTPGHPEAGHTAGVEVTTGPLGQGFGNAVGMALAERYLRATFGEELQNHYTYVIAGDGCLSEGVSHEAASLAGHQKLGKLIAFYDDNKITIDGRTDLALSDDTAKRFEAYGWHVQDLGETMEDLDGIEAAIEAAKAVQDKPSLIMIRSFVGYPSPDFTDNHKAHGNPFDDDSIARAKKVMGLPNEPFHVPQDVLDLYRSAGTAGGGAHSEWKERLASYSGDRAAWDAAINQTGLDGWQEHLATFETGDSIATRKGSQGALSSIINDFPSLIGGSADLIGSNGVATGSDDASPETPSGRQINFGVREHAMGAVVVGAALHGGVIPFGATFLVFADYMRPSVRLAALSHAKCLFVWTHDSVGVGEDGPTHQPVEQIMSLRAIPGLRVIRPADATEAAGAWKMALESAGPSALILSRQGLPVLAHTDADAVARGAYVVHDVADPAAILVATGSEVSLCIETAERLEAEGIAVEVVSMPCWEAFEEQSSEDRESVLPSGVPTVSVEAGITMGWRRWADVTVGIDRFGASAPGGLVLKELGMNVDNVAAAVRTAIS